MIEWEGKPALLATVHDITARKLRERAMEKERAHLRKENIQLRSAIEGRSRFGEIIAKTGKPQTEDMIKDMLAQGDIFEIKPGRIKVLE